MKRVLKVQIAVLVGMLGFFLGGILNFKKEIIEIIVSATIGWAISFFLSFFILDMLYSKKDIKNKDDSIKQHSSKGKKIDILISDDSDDLYKIKR